MTTGRPYRELVALLSTSLGEDTARTIVDREALAAGLTAILTPEDTTLVLGRIEALGGTAGLAARLALTRMSRGDAMNSTPPSYSALPRTTLSPSRPSSLTFNVSDLVSMLARSLGDAKAEEVVARAQQATKIYGPLLTREQAVLLFDRLIEERGAVGTVARFAKARFLLHAE